MVKSIPHFVPDLMLAINILPSSWNEFVVLGKIGVGKKDKKNSETSIAINCNEPTQDEFTFEFLTGWPF